MTESHRLVLVDSDTLADILDELRGLRAEVRGMRRPAIPVLEVRPLSANEVAARLRCRRGKVYAAIASGELIHEDRPGPGGRPVHLVKPSDADAWGAAKLRKAN